MARVFQTKGKHGYSVKFSPYFPQRLACSTSECYGITGKATLFILDLLPQQGLIPLEVFDWTNAFFDVSWAEDSENILVTAAGDGSLQIWDILQPQSPIKVLQEHTQEVYTVDWSQSRSDQFVVSGSWDKTIKIWDIKQEQSVVTLYGHTAKIYCTVWSPHIPACFLSASEDQTLRVWDLKCISPQLIIPAHKSEILSCDWCKYDQNLVFSAGTDGLIRGWDLRNAQLALFELKGHEMAVRRIKASPFTGNILASCSYDFTVRIWDFNQLRGLQTIDHHSEFVYGLDFNLHNPGQIADCSWDEKICVYSPSCLSY